MHDLRGDILDVDITVGDIGDGRASVTSNRLDTATIRSVDDTRVLERDVVDGHTALDAADRQTVAAIAVHVLEYHVGPRVDGNAIILVVDRNTRDIQAIRVGDVEGVGVMAEGNTRTIVLPALLSRMSWDIVISVLLAISNKCVGQLMILISEKLLLVIPIFIKWSGFAVPPLEPWPSQYLAPRPSMTAPGRPATLALVPLRTIGV